MFTPAKFYITHIAPTFSNYKKMHRSILHGFKAIAKFLTTQIQKQGFNVKNFPKHKSMCKR